MVHTLHPYLIFWQPPGYHFEGAYSAGSAPNAGDASYERYIERFFSDVGKTPFYNILTQYSDTADQTHNVVTFAPSTNVWVDTGTALSAFSGGQDTGTTANPLFDSDIQQEVSHAIAQHSTWPSGDPANAVQNEYFVFTPTGVQSCADTSQSMCSTNQYCAYHSDFTSGGKEILYSNMYDGNLDPGCDFGTQATPNDPVADAEISMTSHEMAETVSDPLGGSGWYDTPDNEEVGDLCAWTFGTIDSKNGDVVLNGDEYLIQPEWSNTQSGCAMGYARPTTLTVNSTADASASSTVPLCPNTPGGDQASTTAYSLRCAIGDANNDALAGNTGHTITFAGCSAPCTVSLASQLPDLAAANLTLSGSNGTTIDGGDKIATGFQVAAAGIAVRGLTVQHFTGNGINVVNGSGGVTIGGTATGAGDNIVSNGGYGVQVGISGTDAATAAIESTAVNGNRAGGISLAGLSAGQCATGVKAGAPNAYQPCPTIATVGTSTVTGTSSCKNGCRVEVFLVPSTADASGHGQASAFLGAGTTATDGSWSITTNAAIAAGAEVTATVTSNGATSEFAADVARVVQSPTRSVLSELRLSTAVSGTQVVWRLDNGSDVVGFNVYAGHHRLNRRLIVTKGAGRYSFRLSHPASRDVGVGVVFRDGREIIARVR